MLSQAAANIQIDSENTPKYKKYIYLEKKSGKFTKTNYHLLEKHPLANSLLNFVLAMGYKEGDDFLLVVASYASRCGFSAATVRKAIKYLVKIGHCIMVRHVGKPTEYFFSKYPFTTEEKEFLRDGCKPEKEDYCEDVDISEFVSHQKKFAQNPSKAEFLRDRCRADRDFDEENTDITQSASCDKNLSTATFLVNLYLLYITTNNNNNLLNAENIPSSHAVVVQEKEIKISAEVKAKVDEVIEKVAPNKRECVPKAVLYMFGDRSVNEMAQRTIDAINRADDNIAGFLRRSFQERWKIGKMIFYEKPVEKPVEEFNPMLRKDKYSDMTPEQIREKLKERLKGWDERHRKRGIKTG